MGAGVERVEGRKVWLKVEVRDRPPPPPGGAEAAEGEQGAGGAGGEEGEAGTVFATGSALFIVLKKD